MQMFDDFETFDLAVGDVTVHGRIGGSGPAVVLLHGHPRTHTTWYQVAPVLVAAGSTVVCPDLRGYGHSSKPQPDAENTVYSDRSMAADVVALMTALGHDTFALVGHDRGCYVAFRTALDHPTRVSALAVLDGVPILDALERADARFAELWWHWFFLPTAKAERVILADPLAWYRPDPVAMGQENHDDLVDALRDPATVRAMLADYAAGLHVDRDNDEADRDAGGRIECPVLVAWSSEDDMETLYGDPVSVWAPWCAVPPRSAVIESGHHMAEENPQALSSALVHYFRTATRG